jgi:hypothetical protein
VTSAGVHCAAWTTEAGVSPVGTAAPSRLFVLVEWPLPWPHDVSEIGALAPVQTAARELGGRVQCIASAGRADTSDGLCEVAVLRAAPEPDGFTGPYSEQTVRVPQSDVVGAVTAMLDDPARNRRRYPHRRVLICAHGRRDRCCGSSGTALALAVASDGLGAGVGLWRTSHLGGHRFAPTALILPEATQWARVGAATLRRIVNRSGSAADSMPYYRGFSGFDQGEASVLDRFVLADEGWAWLDRPRRATQRDDGRWRLDTIDGVSWEGLVGVRRTVAVPACGRPIDEATKSEPEFVLESAVRLASGSSVPSNPHQPAATRSPNQEGGS